MMLSNNLLKPLKSIDDFKTSMNLFMLFAKPLKNVSNFETSSLFSIASKASKNILARIPTLPSNSENVPNGEIICSITLPKASNPNTNKSSFVNIFVSAKF